LDHHGPESALADAPAGGRGTGPMAGGVAVVAGGAAGGRRSGDRHRVVPTGQLDPDRQRAAAVRDRRSRDVGGRDLGARGAELAVRGGSDAAHRPARGCLRGRRAMRFALRELWRQPGRFVVAAVILTLITVLVVFLGGLLDGLIKNATGGLEAQR